MLGSGFLGRLKSFNDSFAETKWGDDADEHIKIIARLWLVGKQRPYNNPAMSFSGFSLSERMVGALDKLGYHEPSAVQTAVIPKALRGESLLAQSETGSGKTHAYLIPIIEKLDINLNRPQAIILSPTRELARQIFEFAREFQRFFPKFRLRLYSSEEALSQNEEGKLVPPQLIIGTPGRLKDLLINRDLFPLNNVKTIVLDEADMLLDLGYFQDIEAIFGKLNKPQTMVFSATLKQNLRDELRRFVKADFEWEGANTQTASTVMHHLIDVKHVGNGPALQEFLKIRNPYLCIVFASRVETVAALQKYLKDNNVPSIYFSGALDARSRRKALRDIRADQCSVIVASDILSRGMDIPDVTDVISIDLPHDLDFYFHRAGRTGRFGKSGDSWVFYNADTEEQPRQLIAQGVVFDYFTLKNGVLEKDPVGLAPKTKLLKKKELPEEELKDIKIAKALARGKHIEPMYKKKRQFAIEKVKKKYRRKAIQRSVRLVLEKQWKAAAKKKNGEDE